MKDSSDNPVSKATLTVNDRAIELPVHSPTIGTPVVDISSLASNGVFTYDPGFMSTASCNSTITYIDGDKGTLLHRGYPIDALAERSSYLSVSYLLLHGHLPSEKELNDFADDIAQKQNLPTPIQNIIENFTTDIHPIAALGSVLMALSGQHPSTSDNIDIVSVAKDLLAKVPVFAASIYRKLSGLTIIPSDSSLPYAENFLHMMFSDSPNKHVVNPRIAKALDRIFLLHADHEQNASTSTVRLTGSTGANPYACIVAGISALWGPAHGGANEAVLKMLAEIESPENITKYVDKAKDKNDPFRLMGFGHRVYKNYDPRAKIMQQTCKEVLDELNIKDDPLLAIANQLEAIALEDPYFVQRKLYPNVDFYSGIILKALGIPVNMFTTIFALGRTAGWVAQLHEMLGVSYKIGRPRQCYVGDDEKPLPNNYSAKR